MLYFGGHFFLFRPLHWIFFKSNIGCYFCRRYNCTYKASFKRIRQKEMKLLVNSRKSQFIFLHICPFLTPKKALIINRMWQPFTMLGSTPYKVHILKFLCVAIHWEGEEIWNLYKIMNNVNFGGHFRFLPPSWIFFESDNDFYLGGGYNCTFMASFNYVGPIEMKLWVDSRKP